MLSTFRWLEDGCGFRRIHGLIFGSFSFLISVSLCPLFTRVVRSTFALWPDILCFVKCLISFSWLKLFRPRRRSDHASSFSGLLQEPYLFVYHFRGWHCVHTSPFPMIQGSCSNNFLEVCYVVGGKCPVFERRSPTPSLPKGFM